MSEAGPALSSSVSAPVGWAGLVWLLIGCLGSVWGRRGSALQAHPASGHGNDMLESVTLSFPHHVNHIPETHNGKSSIWARIPVSGTGNYSCEPSG